MFSLIIAKKKGRLVSKRDMALKAFVLYLSGTLYKTCPRHLDLGKLSIFDKIQSYPTCPSCKKCKIIAIAYVAFRVVFPGSFSLSHATFNHQ